MDFSVDSKLRQRQHHHKYIIETLEAFSWAMF